MAYASRTGTRRNLAAIRKAGWGLLISATGSIRTEGFAKYCYDNGAWSAWVANKPFDESAFLRGYEKVAANAQFVILPDIVAGGSASLDFSMGWRDRLGTPVCLQLLPVQDGMDPRHVYPIVGPGIGIFVGGTSGWKEATLDQWAEVAHSRNAYIHVGRVNTARRIHLCVAAGVHSFDGSSVSRYAETLPLIQNAMAQRDLFQRSSK